MNGIAIRWTIAAAGISLAGVALEAQGGGKPPDRVVIRAVTAAGEPVTDLKKEDVSVRTDGRQRQVTDLKFISATTAPGATTASPPAATALPAPFNTNAGGGAPTAPNTGREFLILLDEEGMAPGSESAVRAGLGGLIAGMSASDRVGLIGLRVGGINLPPTTNHGSVREALGKIVGGGSPRHTSADMACRTKRAIDTLISAFRSAPGTRTIVLVSSGLAPLTTQRMATLQDQSSDICQIRTTDLEQLTAAAMASPANLYVLYHPDGLANPALAPTAQQGLENIAGTTSSDYLRIAGNSEGLGSRIAKETSAYYVATLDEPAADAVRRVDGKVNREGVRALIKPLASGGGPAPASTASGKPASTRDMLATTASFTDVPLRAAGFVSRQGASDLKLVALFEPTDPSVKLTAAAVGLVDETKNSVKSQWTAKPDELGRSPVVAALPLAPGTYRVRVAALTETGGGTVDFNIVAQLQDAPPYKFGALMLGVGGGKAFVPRLQFGPGDAAALGVADIYGVPKGANVTVQFEIAEPGDAQPRGSAAGAVQNGPGDDARTLVGGFDINTLEPGDYVMRAIISVDGKVAGTVSRTLRKVK